MKNLIKVSTYAKINGLSTMAVYKRIKAGKLKIVIIDKVKFVNLQP